MFPRRYFAGRFFAFRFWSQSQGTPPPDTPVVVFMVPRIQEGTSSPIGTLNRDGSDDFTIGVSFAHCGVFDQSPLNHAVLTITAARYDSGTVAETAGLSLGNPLLNNNIVSFRVYGGTEGVTYKVEVAASNAPGNRVARSIDVATQAL